MAEQDDQAFEKYVECRLYTLEYELRTGREQNGPTLIEKPNPKTYTQKQAADALGVSRARIKQLEDNGELKRIPGLGRSARYSEAEIQRFRNRRR